MGSQDRELLIKIRAFQTSITYAYESPEDFVNLQILIQYFLWDQRFCISEFLGDN